MISVSVFKKKTCQYCCCYCNNSFTVINTVTGQTLSRSYGRCIAEFLKKGSLVRLGLLDLSTCVGLRYGRQYLYTHRLFWSAWVTGIVSGRTLSFALQTNPRRLDSHTIRLLQLPCRESVSNNIAGTGILTRCPSPTLRAAA